MSAESTDSPPVQAVPGESSLDPAGAIEHYERLLAEHYSWMLGDFELAVSGQRDLLIQLGVHYPKPASPCWALDVGAGFGTQSLALADLGITSSLSTRVKACSMSSQLGEALTTSNL